MSCVGPEGKKIVAALGCVRGPSKGGMRRAAAAWTVRIKVDEERTAAIATKAAGAAVALAGVAVPVAVAVGVTII